MRLNLYENLARRARRALKGSRQDRELERKNAPALVLHGGPYGDVDLSEFLAADTDENRLNLHLKMIERVSSNLPHRN